MSACERRPVRPARPAVALSSRRAALAAVALGVALLAAGPAPAAAEAPVGPGRWLARARLPVPRTEISVAELDGRLYVLGGYVHGSVTSNLVHEYAPAADAWRARQPMRLGLNHVAAVGHEGRLYVFGGFIHEAFTLR